MKQFLLALKNLERRHTKGLAMAAKESLKFGQVLRAARVGDQNLGLKKTLSTVGIEIKGFVPGRKKRVEQTQGPGAFVTG